MRSGFVLIELVIAMAIISVLFFFFMPRVAFFLTIKKADEDVSILNEITEMAYKDAVDTGNSSIIWGIKGSSNIHYRDKKFVLPHEVFSVKVNGEYQEGLRYYFFVYPDGIMDRVKMVFENDKVMISNPLLLFWK